MDLFVLYLWASTCVGILTFGVLKLADDLQDAVFVIFLMAVFWPLMVPFGFVIYLLGGPLGLVATGKNWGVLKHKG